MLNIVNEELMSYSTIKTTEKGKSYTKIKVVSSNKLQQYENDTRYANNKVFEKFIKPVSNKPEKIKSRVEALKPLNREIIRISAPLKNIEEFENQTTGSQSINFELPMSINIDSTNRNQPKVEVRCHEQGDDRANLYVIAFPFNGMIKPIPENPQYRIYKGLIAASVKPFFFNNRKYRKVLYLIIEINKNLFSADHKYHTEEIDIDLESYALFDDPESGKKKTNCEKFSIKILSPNGDYISSWAYDVADEPIMMAVEPGKQLWTTYEVNKNPHNSQTKRSYNKNKKPVTYEGNTMVTINKHGIRKEVTMNNKHHKKPNKKYGDPEVLRSSLDKMMMDSGMFDNDYENNRSKKNGGKNRNGKRGNSKNRY